MEDIHAVLSDTNRSTPDRMEVLCRYAVAGSRAGGREPNPNMYSGYVQAVIDTPADGERDDADLKGRLEGVKGDLQAHPDTNAAGITAILEDRGLIPRALKEELYPALGRKSA